MENQPNRTKKNLVIVAIALMAILIGYLRDSVFKNINALLRAWDLDQDYALPNYLSFLQNYEYDSISNFKWVLTIFFSFLYLFLSIFAIKLLFNTKKYRNIAILTYLGVIGFSAFFILIGMFWKGNAEKMYEFARYLMGMAQSPIILMILIPSFMLSKKEKPKTSKDITN